MDKIEQVIEDFDFEKVHKMKDIISEGDYTESVDDIKSNAIVALNDVANNNKFERKNAGFKAKKNLNGVLSLTFDVKMVSKSQ